jgi:hypothetical protein
MAERLILCSECGTRNRVGGDKAARPKCGNCGRILSVAGYGGTGFGQLSKSVFWFAVGVVTVLGLLYYNDPGFLQTSGVLGLFKTKQTKDRPLLTDEEAWGTQPPNKKQISQLPPDLFKNIKPAPPKKPTPISISTGVLLQPENSVAPFSIVTAPGYNYFVKLVDMNSRTAMKMFIVGGERFETKAPLGTFEIRYLAGHTWYGERNRLFFGKPPETIASKANQLVDFSVEQTETETVYSGHTIELIIQPNGNFSVGQISVDDF